MTPEQLAEIEKRANAATPGPWYRVGPPWNDGLPYVIAGNADPHAGKFVADMDPFPADLARGDEVADAEFIAHARQDVPALLALVREQQARIDSADQAFIDMAQANGGLARSAEKLTQVCRIMSALRGHETPHRVAYNRVWAEVERVKAERQEAEAKFAALAEIHDKMLDECARHIPAAAYKGHEIPETAVLGWVRDVAAKVQQLQAERDAAHALITRLMANRDTVARAVRSPHLTDAEKLSEIREALAVVEGLREGGEGQ